MLVVVCVGEFKTLIIFLHAVHGMATGIRIKDNKPWRMFLAWLCLWLGECVFRRYAALMRWPKL